MNLKNNTILSFQFSYFKSLKSIDRFIKIMRNLTFSYQIIGALILLFKFDTLSISKSLILLSLAYFKFQAYECAITYAVIYLTITTLQILESGLILATFLFPIEEITTFNVVAKLVLWFIMRTSKDTEQVQLSILVLLISIYTIYNGEQKAYKSELHSKLEKLQSQVAESDELNIFKEKPNLSMRVRRIIKKLKLMTEAKSNGSVSSRESMESEALELKKDSEIYSRTSSIDRFHNTEGNEPLDTRLWLSPDEIKDIIYNLVSTDTVLFPQNQKDEADYMNVNIEAKKRYTQVSENTTGSSSRTLYVPSQRASLKPMRSMVEENEELQGSMENIGTWDFNTLGLLDITDKPAFEVGCYVFDTLGLTEEFEIKPENLLRFLTTVEKSYNQTNFYHNSAHAADVTASTVFLLREGVGRCGNLLSIDVFSLIVAALCHDISHPGFNNAFLVAKDDKLAMKYNDQSVLENMHCSTTFKILKRDDCNIIQTLTRPDYLRFRKVVLMAILATDLQRHYDVLNEFKTSVKNKTKYEDEKFRILALQATLKCADIGHGAKELELHKKWSGLITKEFFRQGDTERQRGMTVTALCDRENIVISRSQMGFLNFLAKPLFEVYEEFVLSNNEEADPDYLEIKITTRNIFNNLAYWEEEAQRYDQGNPEYLLDDAPPPLIKKIRTQSRV